jgi:hypothetical protein
MPSRRGRIGFSDLIFFGFFGLFAVAFFSGAAWETLGLSGGVRGVVGLSHEPAKHPLRLPEKPSRLLGVGGIVPS